MSYNLNWGTNHPGHIVYLLDLSGSMRGARIKELMDVLLKVSSQLIMMNKDGGELKERFTISIIGYNSDVFSLHPDKEWLTLKELKSLRDNALRSKTPMFDVEPNWQTYTAAAFKAATDNIRKWIAEQGRKNIPTPAPIVIHITDGEPCEAERSSAAAIDAAIDAANELKSIHVPDGNTLLFNIHIEPGKEPSRFLSTPPSDSNRKFLYEASSELDDSFAARAKSDLYELRSEGVDIEAIKSGCRFMVSNETNKDILVRLIVFGSSVSAIGYVNEPPKPRP